MPSRRQFRIAVSPRIVYTVSMKLHFAHHGLQFFFITIGVEGRQPILSRLVDETHRPALTPLGELLKAALVAMHGAFPAVTISDFIIMPDHFHFLMIVNYEKGRGFNPLWATHRLLDAVEAAWAERTGPLAAPNPAQGSDIAAHLARAIAQGRAGFSPSRGSGAQYPSFGSRGSGAQPPSFGRSPYIELSFDSRQLKTIRRYIKLNPARALWKRRHPERFIRITDIKHPILDPSRRWDAMGNPLLLSSPFLTHVRLTMKKTAEEHTPEIEAILARARCGAIPVSGFISPGEKELLRRLKADPRARFVKMVPFALPPRYDPSAEDSRELAADRLLILSGFPQGVADAREGLRARCLAMNDMAAALCARAQNNGD